MCVCTNLGLEQRSSPGLWLQAADDLLDRRDHTGQHDQTDAPQRQWCSGKHRTTTSYYHLSLLPHWNNYIFTSCTLWKSTFNFNYNKCKRFLYYQCIDCCIFYFLFFFFLWSTDRSFTGRLLATLMGLLLIGWEETSIGVIRDGTPLRCPSWTELTAPFWSTPVLESHVLLPWTFAMGKQQSS